MRPSLLGHEVCGHPAVVTAGTRGCGGRHRHQDPGIWAHCSAAAALSAVRRRLHSRAREACAAIPGGSKIQDNQL